MKHTTKTFFFKTLTLLPNKLGDFVYHKTQEIFDKSSLESKIKKCETTLNKVNAVFKELNISLEKKSILEIGSGWLPIMPYFFQYLANTKQVFTYDINKHYNPKSVLNFNAYFSKMYDLQIEIDKKNKFNLPNEVQYFPSKNVINEKLPFAEVVFSRYVLSHMNENDVFKMHEKFKNEFPIGTIIVHFISPSDLRQHNDSSISMYDFLQYSSQEWSTIHTRFDFHNRLRLPDYQTIFNEMGFETLYLSYESVEKGSNNQKMFQELILHEDFKKYSEEQLTAGNIVIVLKT